MYVCTVDRDAKKSKFLDCLAEFSVYSGDKFKNFLLKKVLKDISKVLL